MAQQKTSPAMKAAAERSREGGGRSLSLRDVRRAFSKPQRREMGDKARAALNGLRVGILDGLREVDCSLPGIATYTIACHEAALCDFLQRLGETDEDEHMDTAGAHGPATVGGVDTPSGIGPPGGGSASPLCVSDPTPVSAPAVSAPSLAAFQQSLRPYQIDVVEEALSHIERVRDLEDDAPESARRILFAAPTGTGKGTVELALLKDARHACGKDAWIYTPSLEVLRGFLERCGADPETLAGASAEKLARLGESIYVTTPTRHRNRILKGEAAVPDVIIYDEVHHATEGNEVSGTLFALAPLAAWIGFTATPYRGSPKGTLELDKAWPDQVEVLTIPEAVQEGWWALPRFEVVGLVDDDKVRMSGGEFLRAAAGNLVASRQDDLAALVRDRWVRCTTCGGTGEYYSGNVPYNCDTCGGTGAVGTLPTAVVVPSRDAAGAMVEALDRAGVSATMVIGTTKAADRAAAYARCKSCEDVLVVVEVLAEGVDLPWLRRMFDCSPTMSPVRWLQRIGRVTRPGDVRPEVIVCCRNLERHAYLLGGLIPRAVIAKAQDEFEKPSKRSGFRSIGFEALRRFKAIDLPLVDGVRGTGYCLYNVDENGVKTDWAVLLDPTGDRSVVARRVSHPDPTGEVETVTVGDGVQVERVKRIWGTYERVEACPEDLSGFATSAHRGKPTTGQQRWWDNQARRYGLDPDAEITRRQFECSLPVLANLGCGMHPTQKVEE